MKAIIDGDEILYNAGFASQHTWYKVYIFGEEDDGWMYKCRYKKEAKELLKKDEEYYIVPHKTYDKESIALYNARMYVARVVKDTQSDEVLLCFSGEENYRNDIAKIQKYKGNRDNQDKPHFYSKINEYLHENYKCVSYGDLEADDLLGIYGYEEHQRVGGVKEDHQVVICTKDKDLNMIPGWRYHTGQRITYWINEEDGLKSFYKQLVTGDSTDNIPGLYRITGKKALPALKKDIESSTTELEMYAHCWYAYWFNSELNDNEVSKILAEVAALLYIRKGYNDTWSAPDWR